MRNPRLFTDQPLTPGDRVLLRGKVAQHLRALEASDAAARCTLSSRRAARNGGTGCARLVAAAEGDATAAALPCVPTNGAGEAEAAARALGTRRC